ncbi:AAA family ATPase [Cereibacter sphaeroides]|uniref:AAA family ATPase n=1 Tax=Cereibacter sphaeroides TaxID=1063 RepID=UPI000E5BCAF7|nr:AAA family ATPase [Cereibacter sphaeroides]RHZ91021.1 AAA family ATPase [Cereibacter sphaeroides]
MQYKRITVDQWRQFREIRIDLHPSLTVLTGPNGSGKSTLLSLLELSMQSIYREPYLATPVNDSKTGTSGYSLGTLFSRFNPFRRRKELEIDQDSHQIGSLEYSSGSKANLSVVDSSSLQYDLSLSGRQHVIGFKIASHRALPRYQAVQSLPVSGIRPKEAFEYFSHSQSSYQRGNMYYREGRSVENPVAPLKETLIGFAAFGADNAHLKAVPELIGLYDKFQDLLRTLLPQEIGFQRLEVRSPEIIVVSRTGEFPIDSASGGLMSLIQTAWQIFLYTEAHGKEAVVLIDEPENHLHPSLQRDFLGNLVRAFPHVQFVVATHSPFVITSVKESKVYALRYSGIDDGADSVRTAVTAQEIDFVSKARTADKILDEVLGVSVTIPRWAENELKQIADKFELADLSEASVSELRAELKSAGLAEFLPEAIGRIARD